MNDAAPPQHGTPDEPERLGYHPGPTEWSGGSAYGQQAQRAESVLSPSTSRNERNRRISKKIFKGLGITLAVLFGVAACGAILGDGSDGGSDAMEAVPAKPSVAASAPIAANPGSGDAEAAPDPATVDREILRRALGSAWEGLSPDEQGMACVEFAFSDDEDTVAAVRKGYGDMDGDFSALTHDQIDQEILDSFENACSEWADL